MAMLSSIFRDCDGRRILAQDARSCRNGTRKVRHIRRAVSRTGPSPLREGGARHETRLHCGRLPQRKCTRTLTVEPGKESARPPGGEGRALGADIERMAPGGNPVPQMMSSARRGGTTD